MRKQLLTAFLLALTGVCTPSAWAVSGTEIPEAQKIVTDQNEYPITFYSESDNWYRTGYGLKNGTTGSVITAVVTVDKSALLRYSINIESNEPQFRITIDGVELTDYSIGSSSTSSTYKFFFVEELTPGTHEISWQLSPNRTNQYLNEVSIQPSHDVSVSLLEPGSLGSEVLYNVDGLKQVDKLTVTGEINDDDWAKIQMMTNLVTLDLSNAYYRKNVVPASQFKNSNIKEVILPEGIKTIEEYAFQGSILEKIDLPASLTNIGRYAFSGSRIKTAVMSDNVTNIEQYAFNRCPPPKIVEWIRR